MIPPVAEVLSVTELLEIGPETERISAAPVKKTWKVDAAPFAPLELRTTVEAPPLAVSFTFTEPLALFAVKSVAVVPTTILPPAACRLSLVTVKFVALIPVCPIKFRLVAESFVRFTFDAVELSVKFGALTNVNAESPMLAP